MDLLFQLKKARHHLRLVIDSYLIRSSDLFDPQWYLENNPDVAKTGADPVQHYLNHGAFEGRDPGPKFDSRRYLNTYADVQKTRINPLVHYLRYGKKEGYIPTSSKVRETEEANLALIRSSGFFDDALYLKNNPDIALAKIDPLVHYLRYGGFEGRDLPPHFYSKWYLDTYEDVRKSGLNPLVHYLKYGKKEGHGSTPPVFTLSRMYDYSKQANSIIFEDSPEKIYLQRPRVIGSFSGELNAGEVLCPRPYVSVIEDAVIFGGRSLVLVRDKIVLSDEMVDFPGREFGIKAPHVEIVHEGAVMFTDNKKIDVHIKEGILLSCGHDNNYFHWLVECLPKLLLMDGLQQFKDLPLLIPTGLHKNLMTALERLNINNRQLICIEEDSACRVGRLIFPSALSRIVDRYEGSPVFDVDIVLSHKWLTRVSERLRSNVERNKRPWRKLFLTRRKGYRSLGNRDELELLLLQHDFEIVELDGASLDFQLELFSQAAVIVAPTGAALTNMLFCQPGTKVIILMSNHEVTNFYFWSNLGAITNLDITIIAGKRLFNLTNYYSVHDDYVVDAELVLEVLGEKRHPMSYSRYLYYKTFVSSIIEICSQWNHIKPSVAVGQNVYLFLKSIEDAIHLEVNKVRSRQAGGYWQITEGDKSYIHYLNRTLLTIHTVLGKPSTGSEEFRMLIDHLEQLLESVETDHDPRIKAVFFVQERFTWPSIESVYEAFVANPACEVKLVYIDFIHVNNDTSRDWFAEYKDLGLPMLRYEDYDLSTESPDLAFFVKPYDGIPMQFYIDELDKVVRRSVYIPYFINWMALRNIDFLIEYHFRLPLHVKAWKIFDAPDFIHKSHVQYGSRKGENVELIGHPKFDAVGKVVNRREEEIPVNWKKKIAGKPVVMWNTHSYIATENWSTFENLGRQVLEYFRSNQQLVLLWRPHPHFFSSLINGGGMTTEQVSELTALVTNSENMILDTTSDYLSAFSVADALISDASSLLIEFLLTRKPIIYTYTESNYSIVNENLLPAFYKASTWGDLERLLQMLVAGKDDKLVERMSVVENFMPNASRNVGGLVMNKCIQDLIAEEIHAGKVLLQSYPEEPHQAL